ncbi:MAG: glycosyltransferase family 2 protein [Candidatus Korobacteraceae bacterium]|jgi:glycosyltransferase involved in cell wall biosynthesis
MSKTLSILTPCFNEEDNIREVYQRVRAAVVAAGDYKYEHIFIDNASTDNTLGELKAIASNDKNVKVIRNTRNFGHIRSPMHAVYQATGDAVIGIVADLQDPPEMIVDLVRKWEEGYPVVITVKEATGENGLMFWIRKQYYRLVNRLSGVETYENYTGFGLYDRKVVEVIKSFDDPYPYFRGMIAEAGFRHFDISYHQPARKRGITKNNFYALYDMAMLAITNLSKVPLRLVTFSGFAGAVLCVLVSLAYLIYKLIFWNRFSVGIAPLVIGVFFFMSLQMLFMGIVGEYIGTIHTLVQKRPLVVEQERINFEYGPGEPLGENETRASVTPLSVRTAESSDES